MNLADLRLLQLVSPALPVGAFAYSEGLEAAVAGGQVRDEDGARRWILGRLAHGPARLEGPLLVRLVRAFRARDEAAVADWNQLLCAFRETRELRDGDRAMGQALARLLVSLGLPEAAPWTTNPEATYPTLFALAAARWDIPEDQAVTGLLWSWLENQVAAAVKLVPLGQTAGQRLLSDGATRLVDLAGLALSLGDEDLGALTPGVALAATHHETLEVRLFRS
jgi:urease accessory protein